MAVSDDVLEGNTFVFPSPYQKAKPHDVNAFLASFFKNFQSRLVAGIVDDVAKCN
jgi:hypothetical protein